MSYSKLLRWYPRGWREENGDVFLGMLEDDAAARGATKPGFAEAWSIRVHGLAERASYKVALGLAAIGALGFGIPQLVQLPGYIFTGGEFFSSPTFASALLEVISMVLGFVGLGLSAVAVLLRRQRLEALPAALVATIFTLSALCAGLESSSWSLAGYLNGARDTNLPAPFAYAGEAGASLASVGLIVIAAGFLTRIRLDAVRWIASCTVGLLAGCLIYYQVLLSRGPGLLLSLAIVVMALVFHLRARQPTFPTSTETSTPEQIASAPPSRASALRRLATAGLVSGLLGGTYLAVEALAPRIPGFSHTQLSFATLISIGALAPIPTILALGNLLRPKIAGLALWSAALWSLGLISIVLAHVLAPVMPTSYLFLLLGTHLATVATALPLGTLLPLRTRWGVTTAVAVGLLAAPVLGADFRAILVCAPYACLALAAWAFWRLHRGAAGPQILVGGSPAVEPERRLPA